MIVRQVRFARCIAEYLFASDDFDLLPQAETTGSARFAEIYMIVLFRAKSDGINNALANRINEQRRIFCSGTKWQGKPAVRFAVANWKVNIDQDWPVVKEVLERAVRDV